VDVVIDGREVDSAAAFHRIAARLLDFGPYYGRNLDALWDRLSRDVPRPVLLIWTYAAVSRRAMGEAAFNRIVNVLAAAQAEDAGRAATERFRFEIHEEA
jgi:ribonuclease inhibitor